MFNFFISFCFPVSFPNCRQFFECKFSFPKIIFAIISFNYYFFHKDGQCQCHDNDDSDNGSDDNFINILSITVYLIVILKFLMKMNDVCYRHDNGHTDDDDNNNDEAKIEYNYLLYRYH